ncbi:MAG: hypothetical protein DWQ02_05165 [Bacteroidetes bacterium]|nr:MAG: hypothetical protein DWQ02_05165 [Bacteroidota bacterium]
MKVTSLLCNDTEELREKLTRVSAEGYNPTLAIVFSSINQDIAAIQAIFSHYEIDLLGCTTAGEIVDDGLYEESIAVLLFDINKDYFRVIQKPYEYPDVEKVASEIGKESKELFDKPGLIVLTSGLAINAEKMISGFRKALQGNVPIYGGLAGDDLRMHETYVFSAKDLSKKGICSLIIDTEKISINGLATSGWEAVGIENTVTEAQGNKVLGINGEKAFTVFSRYFGFSLDGDSDQDKLITLQTNYPFQFIREEGYKVLRSPLLVDIDEGSITIAGSVKKGDKFKFSYSPGFEVIEKTINEFGSFKNKIEEADGIILFSCKGRHGAFGPLLEKEIKGIHHFWKKPLIGFLSYGEIGDLGNGICEFHNETCSLVILKEK